MSATAFGRWLPLAEASASAPADAGIFQIKIPAGLIDYPRGKSAMIHYQLADDLAAAIAAFAAKHPERDWLCRTFVGPIELSRALLARLLEGFVSRVGQPPSLP